MTEDLDKNKSASVGSAKLDGIRVEIAIPQQSARQGSESKEELKPQEINGPRGLEPTRYGDWESKGRCVDF